MRTKEEIKKELEYFKKFLNKKVEIEYSRRIDSYESGGKMKGTIKEYEGRMIFMKQRCTRSFYDVTLGERDGFYATLTVKNINLI